MPRSPATRRSNTELAAASSRRPARIASDVLAPLNRAGDQEGCRLENGSVANAEGLRRGLPQPSRGRLDRARLRPRVRRPGHAVRRCSACVGEIQSPANMAFSMYPGLTHGAYRRSTPTATPEQKATYLPKMVTCEWTGTMNLTEPHAGTDLGLLRTRAEPQGDGSYRITGRRSSSPPATTTWPRTSSTSCSPACPARPTGVKGISLFIVPEVPAQRRRQPRRPQRASRSASSRRRWASTATPPA